jgi:hypothetical protein
MSRLFRPAIDPEFTIQRRLISLFGDLVGLTPDGDDWIPEVSRNDTLDTAHVKASERKAQLETRSSITSTYATCRTSAPEQKETLTSI